MIGGGTNERGEIIYQNQKRCSESGTILMCCGRRTERRDKVTLGEILFLFHLYLSVVSDEPFFRFACFGVKRFSHRRRFLQRKTKIKTFYIFTFLKHNLLFILVKFTYLDNKLQSPGTN